MTETINLSAEHAAALEFNRVNPPGSPVLAWPGDRVGEPLRTRTRYSAWVIQSGHALVSVVGYPGGIALTHVEPDLTRQPAVPDVEFEPPPCPLCGKDLEADADGLSCERCNASWGSDGRSGQWSDPSASRCPAVRVLLARTDQAYREQCTLAAGHDINLHIPADGIGQWSDRESTAVIDSDGEAIA